MKSSVPFRIIGRHNGKLIILRTFPTYISITIGGERHKFPSYGSAVEFLQSLSKREPSKGGTSHEYTKHLHSRSTKSHAKLDGMESGRKKRQND